MSIHIEVRSFRNVSAPIFKYNTTKHDIWLNTGVEKKIIIIISITANNISFAVSRGDISYQHKLRDV